MKGTLFYRNVDQHQSCDGGWFGWTWLSEIPHGSSHGSTQSHCCYPGASRSSPKIREAEFGSKAIVELLGLVMRSTRCPARFGHIRPPASVRKVRIPAASGVGARDAPLCEQRLRTACVTLRSRCLEAQLGPAGPRPSWPVDRQELHKATSASRRRSVAARGFVSPILPDRTMRSAAPPCSLTASRLQIQQRAEPYGQAHSSSSG